MPSRSSLPAAVQVEQLGEVVLRVGAAEHAAAQRLAREREAERVELDAVAELADADRHRRAAAARDGERRLDHRALADRLERVVDADALGLLEDRLLARRRRARASVAPKRLASSSFSSDTSTAKMRAAPAMRAPWIVAMPTPPQPNTATVEPGCTRAVLIAAPTPVVTPQPISAATCSGISLRDRHHADRRDRPRTRPCCRASRTPRAACRRA